MTLTTQVERLAFNLEGQAGERDLPGAGEALRAAAVYVRANLTEDEAHELLDALDEDSMVLHRQYDLVGKSGEEVVGMIRRV